VDPGHFAKGLDVWLAGLFLRVPNWRVVSTPGAFFLCRSVTWLGRPWRLARLELDRHSSWFGEFVMVKRILLLAIMMMNLVIMVIMVIES
jgi:hypothetical protein